MKNLIVRFCFLTLGLPLVTFSQITNTLPKDFSAHLKSDIPVVAMPSFNLQKLQKEDLINDRKANKAFRFGYEHQVDIGIDKDGSWTTLPNGDEVWKVKIVSKGAKTLNFIFDQYRLPKGATLHLYSPNKSFMLGAYTDIMNNENNSLGTWLADGDEIILEYFVPSSAKDQGLLHINKVVHGYRSASNLVDKRAVLNGSADCNQDVNCEIGIDFEERRDILKQSVGLIIIGNSSCTGTLINNTSNDKAPYLLTAFHCGGGEANWSFRFNWISTNTVCAQRENSIDNGSDNYYQTTSGADRIAINSESDFRLLSLRGGLDDRWDIVWAGWDRSGNVPDYTVGIHHPSGDIMKISRDNDQPVKIRKTIQGQTSESWQVNNWDLGVTEGGSSGSALFDPDGRIIGQLFGGGAFCNGLTDNNEPDVYGRFDVSWDFGSTSDSRLSDWLDPDNTGAIILDELIQESSLNTVDIEKEEKTLSVYPNPVKDQFFIKVNSSKDLKYQLLNVTGQVLLKDRLKGAQTQIGVSGFSTGMYFLVVLDNSSKIIFQKKLIIQ